MSALGLVAIVGGFVLLRAAYTGTSPTQVIGDVFSNAGLPTVFQGWGGGGGFTGGGGSTWGDTTAPERVAQWRPLVAQHFPASEVDRALKVMDCESQGNPRARNPISGASGLFQHLPIYWASRSAQAGIPGADIFDPVANVRVAGWLWGQSNTWTHWACKP